MPVSSFYIHTQKNNLMFNLHTQKNTEITTMAIKVFLPLYFHSSVTVLLFPLTNATLCIVFLLKGKIVKLKLSLQIKKNHFINSSRTLNWFK